MLSHFTLVSVIGLCEARLGWVDLHPSYNYHLDLDLSAKFITKDPFSCAASSLLLIPKKARS